MIFVYSVKHRVFCQQNRVFCYISVHSGANIVHPATEYTILSKSCIPEYAIVYSENVVYSVESSCILENTLSPIARFARVHFVYSVKKIVYTEYAKILKQNTLFSEALGGSLAYSRRPRLRLEIFQVEALRGTGANELFFSGLLC